VHRRGQELYVQVVGVLRLNGKSERITKKEVRTMLAISVLDEITFLTNLSCESADVEFALVKRAEGLTNSSALLSIDSKCRLTAAINALNGLRRHGTFGFEIKQQILDLLSH
jgi:hypothetical protein